MKRLIAAALISLGLISSVCATPEVLEPKKGGTPNMIYGAKGPTLKIATYNMAATRVSNIETVIEAVKALDADLIALNEVDIKTKRTGEVDQIAALKKATGMDGVFGRAIDFDGGQYGVAILSKYPIKQWQVFNLPSGTEEQRVLLIAEVQKPGFPEPILFMTSHLDWHQDPDLRIQQVREINNIVLGNTKSNFSEIDSRIKILAGDMNDGADSRTLNELKTIWNPVQRKGIDVRSWPAVNPAQDLDHVLTFKGQRWALRSMIVPNRKAIWNGVDWPAASDHLPLIVRMKLLEQ